MVKIGTPDDYKKLLGDRKIIGKEGCPFCDLEAQWNTVLWRGKHWFIIQNKFPYTGTGEHIMAVPYSHLVFAHEYSSEVWAELGIVHTWIYHFYGKKGYFSCTRETMSDGDRDTRSIEHYHTHFIPGELQGKHLRNMLS